MSMKRNYCHSHTVRTDDRNYDICWYYVRYCQESWVSSDMGCSDRRFGHFNSDRSMAGLGNN